MLETSHLRSSGAAFARVKCDVLEKWEIGPKWLKNGGNDTIGKNSGNIMREHGGILDRLDSLVLSVPIFYIIISCF